VPSSWSFILQLSQDARSNKHHIRIICPFYIEYLPQRLQILRHPPNLTLCGAAAIYITNVHAKK